LVQVEREGYEIDAERKKVYLVTIVECELPEGAKIKIRKVGES
jgi:hypothetical protein